MVTPEQLSLTVGALHVTTALHWFGSVPVEMSLGHPEITGFSLSSTVIPKEQVAVLPEASVAVYVTVVEPTGNELPLDKPAVITAETPGQLSLAVGVV